MAKHFVFRVDWFVCFLAETIYQIRSDICDRFRHPLNSALAGNVLFTKTLPVVPIGKGQLWAQQLPLAASPAPLPTTSREAAKRASMSLHTPLSKELTGGEGEEDLPAPKKTSPQNLVSPAPRQKH